ncbi:hypothetical protein NC651_024465 [Populus alba x Populus x berolinensis]|nr:hypothetical protein NC651_024465 [Populus alba x Populus x berolinensis]
MVFALPIFVGFLVFGYCKTKKAISGLESQCLF